MDEGPLSTLRRNILGGGFNGRNFKAIKEKNDVALLDTATIGCVFQCLKIDIGDFFDCFVAIVPFTISYAFAQAQTISSSLQKGWLIQAKQDFLRA